MPEAEYGYFSRLLHSLALGQRFIAEASFDIEQATQKSDVDAVFEQSHVFVSGLARAGTTVLMRRFHATGKYRSLTYRDMPFVLMPNLWQRLSGGSRKESVRKERAHGDGVMVDYDSPEALEEVFWRVFAENRYLQPDRLTPMSAEDQVVAKFQSYVADIVGSDRGLRYLSKNNNNILRLPSIREAFPNAVLIVPYREPLQQAASLRSQHLKFLGEADPFVKKYMRWLAHHEFGADHRRFHFGGKDPTASDPETLEYWLELWLETYEFLLAKAPEGTLFLGYEWFCSELPEVWLRLTQEANLEPDVRGADPIKLRKHEAPRIRNTDLKNHADTIYRALQGRMTAWIAPS